MKNIYYLLVVLGFTFSACVDDYTDANPARLLDAPAVNGAEIDVELLSGGESAMITVTVSDAPAGIDSVVIADTDVLGLPAGGSYSLVSGAGINNGLVEIEYVAPTGFSGPVSLAVSVLDGQVDEDGEYAGKSSVAETLSLDIVCGDLSGAYMATGTILVDDFGSGPYEYSENLSLTSCDTEGTYLISDMSGGLYTNAYLDAYETVALAGSVEIANDGTITWSGLSDQFGGELVQDATQPTSNYDSSTGTLTIYWTATQWGERGILELVAM